MKLRSREVVAGLESLPRRALLKAEITKDDFGRSLRIPLKFSLIGRARKIDDGSIRFKVKNGVNKWLMKKFIAYTP
jgi:hypothetical protein